MKKRKILVSIALASACLFSLAACGGEEATTTPAPATTTTTTTPAPTTTTTAQDTYAVKYVARFSDGADNEELTSLATTVAKGGKVTQPATAPTKDGYTFLGYKTNLNKDFDFANTTITKATTIYAYFDKITNYHTLVADTANNIIAEDFNAKDAEDTFPEFTSYGTKGLYHTGGGSIVYNNYKAELRQDGTASKMIVDFGGSVENSIIKASFEFTMSEDDNYSFFMISSADSSDPVFGLGMDGNSDGRFLRYKDPAGTDHKTTTSIAAGNAYTVDITIDQPAKKVTVKLNNTVVAGLDETVFSGLLTTARGFEFQTKASKCNLTVNNIAVNVEAASLDVVQAGAKTTLASQYDAYVTSDKVEGMQPEVWADVLKAKTDGDTAIEAATDAAAVKTALTTATNNLNYEVARLRTKQGISTYMEVENWTWTGDAKTKYDANPTKQSEFDGALTTLKANYSKKEAVKATVNATDFATLKTYLFTKNASNELVAVGATDEFSATTDYYFEYGLRYDKDGGTAYESIPTTCNDLVDLKKNFVVEADAIVMPKVDVTVKYYKYDYVAATGITEFASGVDYYTEASGVYTKVTGEFDNTKTYYTYSPVEVQNSQTSYKTLEGEPTKATLVPGLKGYFTLGYFTNATLSTEYTFTSNVDDDTTVIYVEVAKKIVHKSSATSTTAVAITTGTVLAPCVSTQGTVSELKNNSLPLYEVAKNGNGALKIVVDENQKIKITFVLVSTGGSNQTTNTKLIKNATIDTAADAVVHKSSSKGKDAGDSATITEAGVITAYGNSYDKAITVTYELEAGTYFLLTAQNSKALRVLEIDLENITQ